MIRVIAISFVCVSRAAAMPYPRSNARTTSLYAVSESGRSNEELLCLDSLAGNLARQTPRLYRVSDDSWATETNDAYSLWLQDLESSHGVHVDSSLMSGSLQTVVGRFRVEILGYVRCNWADGSTSAALTYAAAGDGVLIAASQAVADALSEVGLPEVGDLRGKKISDVLPGALLNLSASIFVWQDPSKSIFLGDYAIFARAPTMTFGSDDSAQNTLLSRATSPAVAFGWGPDEGAYVSTLTKHGVYVHASDFNKNLAALSNIRPTASKLEKPKRLAPLHFNASSAFHTVTFVMTDGDNLQWTFGSWNTDSKWFGNSQRGSVPVGWTFSPSAASLGPSILQKVMSQLTPNDELVAGPSGIGYINPDLPFNGALSEFGDITSRAMSQAAMNTMSVLQSSSLPNLDRLAEVLKDKDAIFLGYFDGQGKIDSIGQKPVISDRYSLWGEASGGYQCGVLPLIAKLLSLPKDSSSLDGYSVISVHAWTHGYDDIMAVVDGLKSAGGFDVVLPSELVRRVSSLISNATCHCDHAGGGAPYNGFSCTVPSLNAYCSTDQVCDASGHWRYPPRDWNQICHTPPVVCKCDYKDRGAPMNHYTCTDSSKSAYCSSTDVCAADGEWSFPPSDWSEVCHAAEGSISLVV